jgi:hypothetical protein
MIIEMIIKKGKEYNVDVRFFARNHAKRVFEMCVKAYSVFNVFNLLGKPEPEHVQE